MHAPTDSFECRYGTIGEPLRWQQASAFSATRTQHQSPNDRIWRKFKLSGCALVGWGLLQLQLGHMGRTGNVVVGEATSTFYAPVADFLRVESELPPHFDDFKQDLLAKGVKSVQLDAHVFDGRATQPAMTVSAKYVVRLQSHDRT